MKKEDLRHILKQPYQLENWKKVVNFVFPNVSYFQSPAVLTHDNPKVDSFWQIGSVRLNDGKNLAMFEVKVAANVSIPRNRVELRNLVAPLIDQERNHGVLVIYEQGKEDYRFTFTAKETTFDAESADFVNRETASKRFTYLLGANESCRTPGDRFWELSQKKEAATIKDVENAFSVERLSKEFFPKYKQHYQLFVDYLTASNYKVSAFNDDEKSIRDFVKVMLGRIVFLQFVQKKSWLGASNTHFNDGDKNFLSNFWNQSGKNENFYFEHLSRLFFDALNKPGRPNDAFEMPDGTKLCVPYLGGGLFEKDRKEPDLLSFPPELFDGLFAFFDEYNFTIDENDPFENEVGIDPEMLGHIFENLLEDNKDKGAFYTPKPIVKYMCQESLLQYLLTQLEQNGVFTAESTDKDDFENKLGHFVRKYNAHDLIEYDHILAKALHTIKVCDPAIGSGAFPMGILNEMVMLINVLHHASPDVVEDIWQMDNWQPATVKKHIIQNSIYGVDIEKGAVDIARLRFWLSLIIDEEHPAALPSLDYKIVVGNSLVSKLGEDVIDIDWTLESEALELFNEDLKERKKELLRQIGAKQKQYYETTGDKHKLAAEIRNLKIDLLINQLELMINKQNIVAEPKAEYYRNKPKAKFKEDFNTYLQCQGWEKQINRLKRIKANPIEPLDFFDWKLDFPEVLNELINPNVGFDVVIGNPPYVEAKKLKHISTFLKHYRVYSGTADLSSYFFEIGLNLCKNNGLLSLINTNKFFNTGYGRPVRSLILDNEIKQLLNFEQVEVFENILVSSVILSIKKSTPKAKSGFPYKKFFKLKNKEFIQTFIEVIKKRETYYQESLTENEWSFANSSSLVLKEKIEGNSLLLKNVRGVNIFRGVTTGYNPAFIIDEEKKNQLIKEDVESSKLIKPLLQGRNIRKWVYNSNNEYLLFIPWHFPLHVQPEITGNSLLAESEFENRFPSIYQHLSIHKKELGKRNKEETGIRYEWYALQRCAASYYPEFEKSKIIWGLTADKWAYAYDDNGHFLPSNGYILTSEKVPVKYLLAILNSKLLKYYFGFIGVMTAGGAYTLKHSTVQELPIKIASNEKMFIKVVDEILSQKSQGIDTTALEQQIDNLVFRLYDLTYDEVKVVDPEFALSEEEYNNLTLEE